MIKIPVIDTHVHLWDPALIRYLWLDDIPLLNKPFLPEDYKYDSQVADIKKMVFIQCECQASQYLKEVEWVTAYKNVEKRLCGIVSWAPLEKGEAVRSELDALCKNILVKGVRRIIQDEDDIEFCLKPDFIKGVQLLSEYDFSFDLCVIHYQMANVIRFVKQCPNVKFMLDHIGKPDIKNKVFEPWKTEIRQLSNIKNVYCKMSGLVTEADRRNWTVDDLKPYIDHIIACFGFDWVVFGGDWPVVKQAGGYDRWFEALNAVIGDVGDNDLYKLFYSNADNFYRLSMD